MTQRRSMISHNGKYVIYLDHTNLSGAEYVRVVEESAKSAAQHTTDKRLILVDSTGSIIDKDVLQALKKLTSRAGAQIDKTAVLGVSGIQKLFIKTVSTFSRVNIKPFNTKQEALDWLTAGGTDPDPTV